jgi:hypothetical protein
VPAWPALYPGIKLDPARCRRRDDLRERERQHQAQNEPLLLTTNQRIGAVEDTLTKVARCAGNHAEVISELQSENVKLATQLARLEAELAKLQTKQSRKASKSGAVIDLPAMRVAQ